MCYVANSRSLVLIEILFCQTIFSFKYLFNKGIARNVKCTEKCDLSCQKYVCVHVYVILLFAKWNFCVQSGTQSIYTILETEQFGRSFITDECQISSALTFIQAEHTLNRLRSSFVYTHFVAICVLVCSRMREHYHIIKERVKGMQNDSIKI